MSLAQRALSVVLITASYPGAQAGSNLPLSPLPRLLLLPPSSITSFPPGQPSPSSLSPFLHASTLYLISTPASSFSLCRCSTPSPFLAQPLSAVPYWHIFVSLRAYFTCTANRADRNEESRWRIVPLESRTGASLRSERVHVERFQRKPAGCYYFFFFKKKVLSISGLWRFPSHARFFATPLGSRTTIGANRVLMYNGRLGGNLSTRQPMIPSERNNRKRRFRWKSIFLSLNLGGCYKCSLVDVNISGAT